MKFDRIESKSLAVPYRRGGPLSLGAPPFWCESFYSINEEEVFVHLQQSSLRKSKLFTWNLVCKFEYDDRKWSLKKTIFIADADSIVPGKDGEFLASEYRSVGNYEELYPFVVRENGVELPWFGPTPKIATIFRSPSWLMSAVNDRFVISGDCGIGKHGGIIAFNLEETAGGPIVSDATDLFFSDLEHGAGTGIGQPFFVRKQAYWLRYEGKSLVVVLEKLARMKLDSVD